MATRRRGRAARRGAAMVEAIVVIPVFIALFVGMMYFRQLYKHQLVVMRLARAAAVTYAMTGCNGSPTEAIDQDIVASGAAVADVGITPGSTHVGSSGTTNPTVGSGGTPVGSALSDKGMDKDGVASVSLSARASAGSPLYSLVFRSTVTSSAYMSCGEVPMRGDATDALKYVKDLFSY